MANSAEQNEGNATSVAQTKRQSKAGKVFKVTGVLILLFILVALTLNALLTLFKDDYYTTFGKYRLFAIVTDSMEPVIPTGSMIVDVKPTSEDEISVGTVITFRAKTNNDSILLTHRVTAVSTVNGKPTYTTKGDNAGGTDAYKPTFDDVVGVYTGKKIGFFGSLFGFFQSSLGISMLIFCMFIIVVAWVVLWYVNRTDLRKNIENAALKKSAQALSTVNLRYDNITEITAVMDVLGMVTDTPRTHAESKVIENRLIQFVKADNIELPQTPETAAILETLPAPDTPGSLAAAMSQGATLRQAEDGQTLVLTTATGGKTIFLTPVQTADGIILCQQGVRLRSDLAPDLERLGLMSMPTNPEFFEGQPLEKNVIYPELPGPADRLGPELLSSGLQPAPRVASQQLSSPVPVTNMIASGEPDKKALPSGGNVEQIKPPVTSEIPTAGDKRNATASPIDLSRLKYAEHRERAAADEIRQAEMLSDLLADTVPLTAEEQAKVDEYKARRKAEKEKTRTQNRQTAPKRTPEQKAKAKAAADRKKAERRAFIDSLGPEDRELYFAEEKLNRTRQASIRKLKKIAADRKLLEKMEE